MTRLLSGLTASCLLFAAGTLVAAEPVKAPEGKTPSLDTPTEAINYYIADGWQKAGIKKPADKASDSEFLRRTYIDLLGRIATPEEVLAFEEERGAKRAKLVKRLLYGHKNGKGDDEPYKPMVNGQPAKVDGKELTFDYPEEFAEHWANQWTVWLMTRTGHPTYRTQVQAWLAHKFSTGAGYDQIVRELVTASGSGQKNGAVNFIAFHLGENVPADKQAELGQHDAVPITSRVTRLFLGLQTQCTQCHDHPFNKEWVQSDFWGVNAFFRQVKRKNEPTPRPGQGNNMMAFQQLELSDDASTNNKGVIFFERRDGQTKATRPVFLKDYAQADRGELSTKKYLGTEAKSRREAMADYLIGHDNFAKAYVNRVWGHLFGRGLNKDNTIDDFGSHNEVVHPELLDRLATDFVKYGYNTKMLVEWIMTSDVYGLSHVANKEYADAKYDAYFARMPLKAMSPETLFQSLALATRSEASTGTKEAKDRLRDAWMNKLVRNFGDDEGNELTFNGTVVQALLMMNGKELNDEVTRKGGVVEKAMLKHAKGGVANPSAVIDELFLATLNRHATPTEIAALKDVQDGTVAASRDDKKEPTPDPKKPAPPKKPIDPKKPAPGGTVVYGTTVNDQRFYQDVFWALLNTTEFMLNH